MSRLGRDYLKVGYYTEVLFPDMNIHFIAINDGVDSEHGDNEFTPFRNIINEWMARDTSKKIRAVFKAKGMSGEHLSVIPPYGYLKDPNNKKLWIIDEEAAEVVKKIFNLCVNGIGPTKIARILAEERILRPTAHWETLGFPPCTVRPKDPYAWDFTTICTMLERQEYLGHTVNFKTYTKSYKNKKRKYHPPEDWVIIKDMHPAIIDEGVWEIVQGIRKKKCRPTRFGENYMFSGLLVCNECGARLLLRRMQDDTLAKNAANFVCGTYQRNTKNCTTHYIRASVLEQIVLENLQEVTRFVSKFENDFVKMVTDNSHKEQNKEISKKQKKLVDTKKRFEELDSIFKRIYEDNISGKLSDERFLKLSTEYEKEQAELKVQSISIQNELNLQEEQSLNVDRFIAIVKKYTDIKELNPAIVHEFIEKIIVHASERVGRNRIQHIDIYYNCVGVLDFSKQK